MSELVQIYNREAIRWKFMMGASILALSGHLATIKPAQADESSKPNVWIELGGQLSRLNDGSTPYVPDFESLRSPIFSPTQNLEKAALFGLDEYGKISLQPDGSNWVISAAIQYGRSSVNRHVRQQTNPGPITFDFYRTLGLDHYTKFPRANRFSDTTTRNNEQHLIVDFTAGKDVGLGLFGNNSASIVSLGVRFAQFVDKSNIALRSDPDWHVHMKYYSYYGIQLQWPVQPYHSNIAGFTANRSFHGIGPELSWNASVPLAGNPDRAELNFDWGVNAAVLFGRQKTRIQHHETERYNDGGTAFILFNNFGTLTTVYRHTAPPQTRTRNVIVPNIGGFAGISFKYDAAKVTFGYRGDFFFGAMDGGIDTHKSYGRNFFGPYATVSIGLGG